MFKMFKVGELFDVHPTAAYKMKNDELFASDGATPVLSNSSVNNGIGGYCGLAPTEQGGMITFSDTTTGADTMFYQSNPFIGYPHVQGMYPYQPDKWNEKCCLYVISCIRKSAGNGWSYAVKFNRALVKELPIELPVIESPDADHEYTVDDIDYEYMQERIAELEQERIAELDAYLVASGLDDHELTDEDKEALSSKPAPDEEGDQEGRRWDGEIAYRPFPITDIFDVKNTKCFMKSQVGTGSGETPYLTASSANNGVGAYIGCDKDWLDTGNCIFIGGKTMVVSYQERDFVSNDSHNLALYLKDKSRRTRRTQLFLCAAIRRTLSKKYYWGDPVSWRKIQTDKIMLPTTSDGAVDFDFMERYIRAVEKLAIRDVASCRDGVLDAAKRPAGA